MNVVHLYLDNLWCQWRGGGEGWIQIWPLLTLPRVTMRAWGSGSWTERRGALTLYLGPFFQDNYKISRWIKNLFIFLISLFWGPRNSSFPSLAFCWLHHNPFQRTMAGGREVNFPLNENDCTHLNNALRSLLPGGKIVPKCFLILIYFWSTYIY